MDIVAITGGLGNQMFQYAMCLALEEKGHTVKLDISKYKYYQIHNNYELENVFGINEKYATALERMRYGYLRDNKITRWILKTPFAKKSVICESDNGFNPSVFSLENRYFKGYWQNEKYFLDIQKKVREVFRFRPLDNSELVKLANEISSCESVSMHIRRGDYLSHPLYSNICDREYYMQALDIIRRNVKSEIRIYAFSNDIDWVKKNFDGFNISVVDINHGKDSYRDMQLMSLCTHNIIANSSFSWWGAWLNNNSKIVIAPRKWVNSDKKIYDEIVPESWIRI